MDDERTISYSRIPVIDPVSSRCSMSVRSSETNWMTKNERTGLASTGVQSVFVAYRCGRWEVGGQGTRSSSSGGCGGGRAARLGWRPLCTSSNPLSPVSLPLIQVSYTATLPGPAAESLKIPVQYIQACLIIGFYSSPEPAAAHFLALFWLDRTLSSCCHVSPLSDGRSMTLTAHYA